MFPESQSRIRRGLSPQNSVSKFPPWLKSQQVTRRSLWQSTAEPLSYARFRESRHHYEEEGERRGCLRTDIDLTETTLHVFNVHLGTSFLERRQQARKLVGPEILQNPAARWPTNRARGFQRLDSRPCFAVALRSFRSTDIRTQRPVFVRILGYSLYSTSITCISTPR